MRIYMCAPQAVDMGDPIAYTVCCSCKSSSELEA